MRMDYLKSDEIRQIIKALAQTKGSYQRLYDQLEEEDYEYLEQQCFKDEVDLIMFLEGEY